MLPNRTDTMETQKSKREDVLEREPCWCSTLLPKTWRSALQHTAAHCNILQNTTIHCNPHADTVETQKSERERATKRELYWCSTLLPKTRCSTLQHTATHCNALQHTATHGNTRQHTATHGNTLQHTVAQCTTLQHTISHNNSGLPRDILPKRWGNVQPLHRSTHIVRMSTYSWETA